MYLLRTRDATLHHFNRSNEVKYAILSHRWKNPAEENSFVDIVSLTEECSLSGVNPRDHVCDKIRECCLFAERAGYEWIWIDTCCIDHNSSAELSEAINSMYAWYADADICFAYLFDVDDDEDPTSPNSAFRRSEWFERGWTLQELIAPSREIFISKTWHTLGSKHMFADVVQDITGVDRNILTHRRSLDSVCIAQRMSWASRRQTSRVEDRAYSLLGIFGINIPAIYGEGERAFIRLQEEILRRIPDQTIFAWGPMHADIMSAQEVMEQDNLGPEQRSNDPRNTAFDTQARLQELLAPSPAEFVHAAGFRPIPIMELAARFRLQTRIPQYRLSSYGIMFCIPLSVDIIESWKSWIARTGTSTTQHVQVGLIACECANGDLIALFLRRANNPAGGPQYAVGEFIGGTEGQHYYRGSVLSKSIWAQPIVDADPEEAFPNTLHDFFASILATKSKSPPYTKFFLREIYIHHKGALQVASYARQDGTIREIMATRDHFTFTFPPWLLTRLSERYGLLPMRNEIDGSAGMRLQVPFRPSKEQITRGYLASLSFADPMRREKLTIVIGVGGCICLRALPPDGVPLHKLWVAVRVSALSPRAHSEGPNAVQGNKLRKLSGPSQTMPRCKETHVDFTLVRADDFMIKTVFGEGDQGAERRVEIEFRKWEGFERIRPIVCQSHVVTLDLAGTVYERGPLPFPKIYSSDEVPPSLRPEGTVDDVAQIPKIQVSAEQRTVRFSSPISESGICDDASEDTTTTVSPLSGRRSQPTPGRLRNIHTNQPRQQTWLPSYSRPLNSQIMPIASLSVATVHNLVRT